MKKWRKRQKIVYVLGHHSTCCLYTVCADAGVSYILVFVMSLFHTEEVLIHFHLWEIIPAKLREKISIHMVNIVKSNHSFRLYLWPIDHAFSTIRTTPQWCTWIQLWMYYGWKTDENHLIQIKLLHLFLSFNLVVRHMLFEFNNLRLILCTQNICFVLYHFIKHFSHYKRKLASHYLFFSRELS